ncbi:MULTISPECIES: hypothetical protein [Lacticaseibacillus]|uniref:Uncharacterized protein n=2 Tax=Lacticaseibacillus TaxID=2759736 RepID=A0AAN1C617_LACCA|nr:MULTISPECIES: hypothetical protein [Lacticaseibacillus]ARY90422.1 hypothetical protein BGL52_01060 [Lacticaseibacillus casei]KAB1969833.1 hypothetical protein F9B82_05560 [Lacticaseibacillus casei]WLV81042.1 hypothetical protein LACSTY_000213 [Lacticaseibacillus sp. NCIMB 15473]WNX25001.1 hypothetical protein RWA15_01065 [Lacticaseibacillus casei]WNX27773.1 hypothetical protein RWA16_01070 [Lacticaseibacillus casei]
MENLTNVVAASLPQDMRIAGINIAHTSGSTYWLLYQQSDWLTLRLATHVHWLNGVQQLQVIWPDMPDATGLKPVLTRALLSPAAHQAAFEFRSIDIAIANMLLWAANRKLVFMLRLTPAMASAHKHRQFDLHQDLEPLPLFLGDRNNSNDLLLPVADQRLKQHLIRFYSRNLLFTQFSGHHLIKLLPTAQWLQTMLAIMPPTRAWPLAMATTFGTQVLEVFHQARLQHL